MKRVVQALYVIKLLPKYVENWQQTVMTIRQRNYHTLQNTLSYTIYMYYSALTVYSCIVHSHYSHAVTHYLWLTGNSLGHYIVHLAAWGDDASAQLVENQHLESARRGQGWQQLTTALKNNFPLTLIAFDYYNILSVLLPKWENSLHWPTM